MSAKLEPEIHREVQRYYGETLENSADLKTNACCTEGELPAYVKAVLAELHEEIRARYYGCGLVIPEALEGMRVLDLGCGAGQDCYLLSRLVGPEGRVVGVDMTPEQLAVAKRHREYHADRFGYERSNVEFLAGNIERLDEIGLEDGSFDLIVSNCVVNLAVDKAAVLRGAHRLLRRGGEFYFADIYSDRRVPDTLKQDPVLYGECLAGAMYWKDFLTMAQASGFTDPRLVADRAVAMTDPGLADRIGDLRFYSATYRLFRVDGLEPACEDYGQAAEYRGTVPHHPERLVLDKHYVFETGELLPICGNTQRMLAGSRLGVHFRFAGDRHRHYGIFPGGGEAQPFDEPGPGAVNGGCC